MAQTVERLHKKRWHQSPKLEYRVTEGRRSTDLVVDVTGSPWPLGGVQLSRPVLDVLEACSERGKRRVLDFGAGVWLRYGEYVLTTYPSSFDLFVVEFPEAFQDHGAAIAAKYTQMCKQATVWTPREFNGKAHRDDCFDAILLVNVLNTIPEPEFRAAIIKAATNHLFPTGWLAVYQRVWVAGELPKDQEAYAYQDGWIVTQARHDYCTFRASTGARWFTEAVKDLPLRPLDLKIPVSSGNTFFRVWTKRFE